VSSVERTRGAADLRYRHEVLGPVSSTIGRRELPLQTVANAKPTREPKMLDLPDTVSPTKNDEGFHAPDEQTDHDISLSRPEDVHDLRYVKNYLNHISALEFAPRYSQSSLLMKAELVTAIQNRVWTRFVIGPRNMSIQRI
jgi:hypothetical protein